MNSKSTVTLKKLVMAALFAALACVATMSIKIPTPGTSGYIHPGDAIVILAGVVLGPAWGFPRRRYRICYGRPARRIFCLCSDHIL